MIPALAALMADAWALDCAEVANMHQAGVPAEELVAAMDRVHWAVGPGFASCLAARGVDPDVVLAVKRVPMSRTDDMPAVDGSWATGPTPRVAVELACGLVRVRGTDTTSVRVTGVRQGGFLRDELSRGADLGPSAGGAAGGAAEFRRSPGGAGGLQRSPDGAASGTRLSLALVAGLTGGPGDPAALPRMVPAAVPRRPDEPPCGVLELEVPHGSALDVQSTRADVFVRGVEGPVAVTSHFGDVEVVGDTPELVLKSTGGALRADTGARFAEVSTVSGLVELGLGHEARATVSSVSGPVWVWGAQVRRLRVDTVSGDVHVLAGGASGGEITVATHNGSVEGLVPDGSFDLTSHSGATLGPPRLLRPDGPSARLTGSLDRFSGIHALDPATRSLWANDRPDRWWFPSGAVISRVVRGGPSDWTFTARSFSGDVRVRLSETRPGPTGPVIARLEAAGPRFDECARSQLARHPGVDGHAVLHLFVDEEGRVSSSTAPATAHEPAAVADGRFSACVLGVAGRLAFDAGARTELRWPVRFGAPTPSPPSAPPALVEGSAEP